MDTARPLAATEGRPEKRRDAENAKTRRGFLPCVPLRPPRLCVKRFAQENKISQIAARMNTNEGKGSLVFGEGETQSPHSERRKREPRPGSAPWIRVHWYSFVVSHRYG